VSIISKKRRLATTISAFAVALSVGIAQPAHAQLTTATIRGHVTNSNAPAPGTTVIAKSLDTGAVSRSVAGPDGGYVLTGLSPGSYDVSFGGGATQRVIVGVGQSASLDMDLAAPAATAAQAGPPATTAPGGNGIVVTGRRLIETRTSEVATNVTSQQIENLPQSNRNFLNFATLAPGIRLVQSGELRQTFGGAGVGEDPNGESFGGPQVNVFIDGVSLKSNVQQGGVVGQDVSAGNPFSQLAIKEFRVLTSNFKAEYEDAGTSIITAVTKSGTNEFHGEAFGLFSNQSLIAKDYFQKQQHQSKTPLKRYQYGAALGGPIIHDKLFFFVNYEANLKDRNETVVPGPGPDDQAALLGFNPQQYAGTFVAPFREHLGFGKLTFLPTDNNTLELTGSIRKETDNRDFGDQNAVSRGAHVKNDVYTAKLEDRWVRDGFLNEATVDWLKYKLDFGAASISDFGQIFPGIISIGSRADFQQVLQQGLTFRDNFSFTNLKWNGDHLVKIGAKLSFQKYQVGGTGPFANPQFEYSFNPDLGLNYSIPTDVRFGGGNPNISAKTTQIGLFAQDDWQVNRHLLINAGVRWDVDTNAKNKGFVTPQKAVQTLLALGANPLDVGAWYDVNDYISTGNNRKIDWNNIAPRIGFSYDLNADQGTVFFGGYGRFYDRALFRATAEESLLSQYQQGEIFFSSNGQPINGQQTIKWDPNFLTAAGLQGLIASLANNPLAPGTNELRVIPNDLKTPYTDQFSIGVRQRFGIFHTSLTFSHVVGKDQIAYGPLNRGTAVDPNGFYVTIPLINGYGIVTAISNARESKYNAIYLTVDKPYSKESGWGGGIAYTGVLTSKEKGLGGGGGFNFDYPDIPAQFYVPNAGDERHHVVINGMVDLPFDSMLSGLITYGSGSPYFIVDARNGFQPGKIKLGYYLHAPAFFQVDLRLQKFIHFGAGREIGVSAEVFNLFNRNNFTTASNTFFAPGDQFSFTPGSPAGTPRTFQFGANVRF
jgi:outer membrane receptor protein involved in Fe transport